ncbi:hypothetical protein ACQJBY_016255 [Aegilops geniculata]
MVERERDEGEAMAMNGPGQEVEAEAAAAPATAVTAEKGEGERDDGERADGDEREEGSEEEEEAEKKDKVELEEWSELRLAIAELSPVSRRGGKLCSSPPTLPFLGLSHLLLQLLDKIGPTMAVLRLDVQRNIERLQELYLQDPSKYSTLTAMVEKEADDGTSRKADSCSRAILWLTRSMDFTVALLQRLEEEEEEGSDQQSLAQLVEAAYKVSLKPWHGWISSAACKIALKLIPERAIFVGWLMGENQNCSLLKVESKKLVQLLQPFLDDIHAMLAKFKLDRLKST